LGLGFLIPKGFLSLPHNQKSPKIMPLQLPTILEPFREKIESTLQKTVRVQPKKELPTSLIQSKIGGLPYWPKDQVYPRNPAGNPLFFLAQLNFREIPALPGFPLSGILQFFILNDDLYGMNMDQLDDNQNFRVVYHTEPLLADELLESAFPFWPQPWGYTPIPGDASFALDFAVDEEWLGPPDYWFDEVYPEAFLTALGEKQEEAMDFFYELGSKSSGHKVGGYAFFTQCDPRKLEIPMQLLFQLDSDNDIDSMWGDMGIGNFFILPEDLKTLRFDRVLFHWDCS
jgi:uncharacterized protein YwqG